MRYSAFIIVILAISALAQNNETCQGEPNMNPPINAEPQLLQSVPHGKKYIIPYLNTSIHLGVFNGTPYQIGYANGELFKDEIKGNIDSLLQWVQQEGDDLIIKYLPDYVHFLKNLDFDTILQMALEDTAIATAPYTPKRYEDELKGMADGSGLDEGLIKRINLFPELIRAHCTIIGAWGPATQTGKLL